MTSDHPHDPELDARREPDEDVPPAPWSFKIMVVLAGLYLVWRLIQGVAWIAERIL